MQVSLGQGYAAAPFGPRVDHSARLALEPTQRHVGKDAPKDLLLRLYATMAVLVVRLFSGVGAHPGNTVYIFGSRLVYSFLA